MKCDICSKDVLKCRCEGGPTAAVLDQASEPTVRYSFEEDAVPRPPVRLADEGLLPAQDEKFSGLADRLSKRFGLGDRPVLRRALFDRLQRECTYHGEVVYRIIASACRSSESAREPDRYFCSVVSRRMREAGFLVDEDQFLV